MSYYYDDQYQPDPREAAEFAAQSSGITNAPLVVSNIAPSKMASSPKNSVRILLIRSGTGRKFDTCGTIAYAVACESKCIPVRYIPHHCNRLGCPVDYDAVAVSEAKEAEARLEGMAKLYRQLGKDVRQIRHVVWSVPKDYTSRKELEKDAGKAFRKEFHDILKKAAEGGFYGGIECFHPWRLQHLDGTPCEDPDCKRAHTWLWGPHFHFIGYGRFADSPSFEKKTGWLYHVVTTAKGKDRSAFGTIYYVLTHCGIFVDANDAKYRQINQAVRWVGQFSNSKGGKKVVKKEKKYELCPKCAKPLKKYDVDENGQVGDFMFDEGEFYTVDVVVEYYLAAPKSREEKLLKQQDVIEEYEELWRKKGLGRKDPLKGEIV